MELEMERSKKKMRDFKLNKFLVVLNSLLVRQKRTHRYNAFNKLQTFSLELSHKFRKLDKHTKFHKKFKILKLWSTHVRKIINDREIETYERKKRFEVTMNNRADRFHLHTLYKLTLKSLRKNINLERAQREIEEEHE